MGYWTYGQSMVGNCIARAYGLYDSVGATAETKAADKLNAVVSQKDETVSINNSRI